MRLPASGGGVAHPLARLLAPSACTLAGMSRLRRVWLLMLVLGTLVSPRLASAQTPLGLETRVGGLDLAAQVIVGVHALASPGSYLGNPDGYDENASGCSLAAGGGAGTAIAPYYPPNNGFLGPTANQALAPGSFIDRFGGTAASRFFSPAGTPLAARALPPDTAALPLRTFEVLRPLNVESGTVAPWFGQLGLGTQYRTSLTLEEMLRQGLLREVTR